MSKIRFAALKGLFRTRKHRRPQTWPSYSTIEALEGRQLLAAALTVTDSSAPPDDRVVALATTLVGNTSPGQTFTLANTGTTVMTVSNFVAGGANPTQFLITVTDAVGGPVNVFSPFTIAAGTFDTVMVQLRPTVVGTPATDITFDTDDVNNANVILSASGSAVSMATIPAAPTNFVATPLSTSSIQLTWTDNAINETGYRLYRATAPNGTYSLKATLPANTTTYTHLGLKPATQYYYHLVAFNAGGNSGTAWASTKTLGSTVGPKGSLDMGNLQGTDHIVDSVGDGNAQDIYTFRMVTKGRIIATLFGLSDDVDMYLYRTTPTQRMMVSSVHPGTTNEHVVLGVQGPGVYFIKLVRGFRSVSHADYHLDLTADYTPNIMADARETALNGTVVWRTFSESVGFDDKTDFYKFTLTGHHRLIATLTDLENDADIQLLDSTGRVVAQSTNSGTAIDQINVVIGQGLFYVKVLADINTNTNYTLSLRAEYPPT